MLSIDEVITALEQGPRSNIRDDAVTYLTEYKGLSKMWNDKLDKERENPSLSWDELKAMEGKPVWIENKHFSHYKFWGLISVIRHRQGHDYLVIKIPKDTNLHLYNERYLNDGWQAYRKERA